MRVVPAAPLRSNSLSLWSGMKRQVTLDTCFQRQRDLRAAASSYSGHVFSAQVPTVFSISDTEGDEERNHRSAAPGAALRVSSQPNCGSSQVPAAEDDVQQDSYSTESHDHHDQQLPHGPQMQPSAACQVPAEQFWSNLGHLFHDTIDGTLHQSLPRRAASQQERAFRPEQSLAPLDRRKTAEVLDPKITQESITPTEPLCTITQRVPSSPHEGHAPERHPHLYA